MRAISCALISLVLTYQGLNNNHKTKAGRRLGMILVITSWIFLIASVVFMIMGK